MNGIQSRENLKSITEQFTYASSPHVSSVTDLFLEAEPTLSHFLHAIHIVGAQSTAVTFILN